MENAALENSIREEAARLIADIREKEELEIRRQDDAYSSEMEKFRKKAESETQARIDQEISRLENRSALERKKIGLRSVDEFISRASDEAVKEIRNYPNYRKFLLEAVSDIIKEVPGSIEIKLNREDMSLKDEIFAAAGAAGRNKGVMVTEDASVKWGGCLVIDRAGGRVFNNTIERIYFRKSLLIRQNVMEILNKYLDEGMETV